MSFAGRGSSLRRCRCHTPWPCTRIHVHERGPEYDEVVKGWFGLSRQSLKPINTGLDNTQSVTCTINIQSLQRGVKIWSTAGTCHVVKKYQMNVRLQPKKIMPMVAFGCYFLCAAVSLVNTIKTECHPARSVPWAKTVFSS
jgi:hypothetical protein